MNRHGPIWLLSIFAACFLAVGVPYWLIPYHELSLPDALIGPGLALLPLAAFALRVGGSASWWKASALIGASMPAVVLARAMADTMKGPTSHNLWPLEIAIAVMMGLALALAGAVAGNILVKLIAFFERNKREQG